MAESDDIWSVCSTENIYTPKCFEMQVLVFCSALAQPKEQRQSPAAGQSFGVQAVGYTFKCSYWDRFRRCYVLALSLASALSRGLLPSQCSALASGRLSRGVYLSRPGRMP